MGQIMTVSRFLAKGFAIDHTGILIRVYPSQRLDGDGLTVGWGSGYDGFSVDSIKRYV